MAVLRALTLSHFRSHKAFALEPDGRPVAFFGPNGAGKTNILEAISLLSPGRGLRGAAPDDLSRQPEALGWRIKARIDAADGAHEVITGAEGGGRRTVVIDEKAAPQVALGALIPMLWLTPAMDRLWMESPSGRRRFLDRLTLAFEPGHGAEVLAYEHAMRERNRLFAEGRADPAWLTALEGRMAKAGAAMARARAVTVERLMAAQEGAGGAFPRAILRIEGFAEPEFTSGGAEAEAALAEAFAKSRRADAAAGRALAGPHRSDLAGVHAEKNVEARLASTGEQKALLIAIILAHARALSEDQGAPPVLLLDEVAAHLDEGRRAALYDEILHLAAPAFMTGTGPELFAPLGERGMMVEIGAGGAGR